MRIVNAGIAALTLLALTGGSALAQKVEVDYDKNANFGRYGTFQWIKEPTSNEPLMSQRIVEEVNRALTSRGMRLAAGSEQADLALAAHIATREERTLNTFYDGFGGGWRWGGGWGSGFGVATTSSQVYEIDTLVVDIFDSSTKMAIWRGTSTKTLSSNPGKNTRNLTKAIDKMFERFPPAISSARSR